MKPKRARELYKSTAEDLELPEELVNDVLSFFWGMVYKDMSDIRHPAIRIPNLGVFRLRYKDVDREIVKITAAIEKHKSTYQANSMKKYAIIKTHEERLQKLLEMQQYLRTEMENQRNFEKAKKDGRLIQYLEEQRKNLGGNKEQDFQKGTCGGNCGEKDGDM